MYRVRKTFKFEGAHILSSAYSLECTASIHGHSYTVEVFLKSRHLNADGMVVDFKRLKEIVGPIIDKFDHQCLINAESVSDIFEFEEACATLGTKMLPVPWNPTAENMCKHLFYEIREYGEIGHILEKVRMHETLTGSAEFHPG